MKVRLHSLLPGFLRLVAAVVLLWPVPSISAADLSQYVKPETPPSPGFNPPSPEKIALGEKLFFDPRLSDKNSMSCASCHQPSYNWTDPNRFSAGENGVHQPRRTPSLEDAGWNVLFARDGRIESLEGFVLGPISHKDEMNQNLDTLPGELARVPEYPALFEAAFGSGPVLLDKITQSLGAFVRTIKTGISPFDRWVSGDKEALSTPAQAGFKLFTGKAGCNRCHSGWRFTDQKFHDIGLETDDLGRGSVNKDNVLMTHAFKTTPLRNVAMRPPYMHDGRFATLDEVIEHYQSGIIQRSSLSHQVQIIALSHQEKVNLVEFLKSLTDDR